MSLLNAPPVGRRHSLYNHSDLQLNEEVRHSPLVTETSISSFHPSFLQSDSSNDSCQDETVTLNVGGHIFKTYINTLKKIKGTKLNAIVQRPVGPFESKEYFFDRNPDIFASLLDYGRINELHIPKKTCVMQFRKELEYWGVSEMQISECCKRTFIDGIDEIRLNESLTKEFVHLNPKNNCKADCTRGRIYNLLHYPESSLAAKIWAVIHYILVVMSVMNIFLSTVPGCRVPVSGESLPPLYAVDHDHANHPTITGQPYNTTVNYTTTHTPTYISDYWLQQMETNSKIRMMMTTTVVPTIQYIDIFCLFYFTAEFIARLLTVTRRVHMLKQFFTLCDLMYLIPVWILWVGQLIDEKFWRTPQNVPIFLSLQCFIVARVVALFRVANQFRALRILVLSLKASLGEIFLLLVFVVFAMIVYSSLIYCVEIFIVKSMDNMFHGLWWSIITMTTVGYGDSVPKSGLGYFVASLCTLTGIILIGMVVPIITSNFHKYYGFRHFKSDERRTAQSAQEQAPPTKVSDTPETNPVSPAIQISSSEAYTVNSAAASSSNDTPHSVSNGSAI